MKNKFIAIVATSLLSLSGTAIAASHAQDGLDAASDSVKQGKHKCGGKKNAHKCGNKKGAHKCGNKKGAHKCSGKKNAHKCGNKKGASSCASQKDGVYN